MEKSIEHLFKIKPAYIKKRNRQGSSLNSTEGRMPPYLRVVYEQAVIAYRKQHYREAASLFRELLEKNIPSSVCAYFAGISFMKLNNEILARQYFKQTIALKKHYYHAMYAHIFLAYFAIKRNNFKEATHWLKLPIANNFESPLPYSFMGFISHKDKKYELAAEYYKKCIARDPENPSFKNNLAFTYVETNQNLAEAENLIKDAVSKDKTNPAYLHSWGWVLFLKKRLNHAVALLTKASHHSNHYTVAQDLNMMKRKLRNSS